MHDISQKHLPVVLVGLPGVGKTRVGERLAVLLGVPHLDTDNIVEERTGRTISELFDLHGEAEFRRLEMEALQQALKSPAVISVGGGAVETEAVRELLATQTVVHLRAEPNELLRRIRRSNRRPLMRNDPEGVLARLHHRRTPFYESVQTFSVWSSDAPVKELVSRIVEHLMSLDVITVAADPMYPVLVGVKTTARGIDLLPRDAQKVVLVHPADLLDKAEALAQELGERGLQVTRFAHPAGEAAKDASVAAAGWDLMGEARIGRTDLVVTLGGGATTDLGGFLAATWMRGIRVAHFPTSLLAMVDASVGGKTGINASAGKNLIGSFHNPVLVCVDLDYLCTLPNREFTAGWGEIIKCGFIADPEILAVLKEHPEISSPEQNHDRTGLLLQDLVSRSIRVKARVVEDDFEERGLREILNYGHTLAHAIEKDSGYSVLHGEAVAIGCVFAAELGASCGLIDRETVELHRQIFSAAGLPIEYRGSVTKLMDLMYLDKKTRGDKLRYVLLDRLGEASTRTVVREQVEEVAWRSGVVHE